MHFDIAIRASQGARRAQEDTALAWPRLSLGDDSDSLIAFPDAVVGEAAAVLCDGMGGHIGGAIASRIACEAFLPTLLAGDEPVRHRLIAALGNIPGDFVNTSIQALRPLQRSANQMKLLNNVENDAFVKAHLRFDRWATDQLPVPGELARALVKDFIVGNKFVANELMLRGDRVDLGRITVPFLHVAAQHDHIVPAAASRDLIGLVGSSDKQEIVMKGGHVSLVAGGNAVFRLWPQLDAWLSNRGT